MSWQKIVDKANAQVDQCVILAKKYVLPWWGVTLHEFATPIPESVHALYVAHESAMKYKLDGKLVFAPARFLLTNYPEIGPDNLTAKKGDDEVRRWKKHPYNIRSHFWAAQQSFWEGKAWLKPILVKCELPQFERLSTVDQLALLLLPRAIGLGCTRGLLRKQMNITGCGLMNRIETWLRNPKADTTPFDGAQTTDVVRLRFLWCTKMICRAVEVGLGPLPSWNPGLQPPVADPGDLVPLPKDFHVNMKAYSRAARNQGPTPTGSWGM